MVNNNEFRGGPMAVGLSFDYVIVGAGSAGCTLANRLTEDPSVRVIVLEAGGWVRDPWLHIPLAWGRNVLQRRKDWMYWSEPEPGTVNRRIPINRGKVIGGSSSINGLAYVRGHRGDYDRWAQQGLSQWSYAHVLPYFRNPMIRSTKRFSKPGSLPAFPSPKITTARSRKASAARNRRSRTAGAAAPRSPISIRRSPAATTSPSRSKLW